MAALDDLLTCAVCLDWFRSPRRLPCHHVYCLQCIRDLVIHDTDYITCPECRCDHVMPNGGVEDFPTVPVEDGRLEQFIATQRRPGADWCKDCQQGPSLGECEHCQLLTCLQCQTKHRDLLLATLIQQWRQFHNEYFSDSQMVAREKLKNELLLHKENIEDFKTSVNTEIDDLIKALEIRRLSLITKSEEKEHFIVDQLLKLEKAELIYAQNPSYITRLVDTCLLTKGVVSMKEELDKQKQFMNSLQSKYNIKKGMLCITFRKKRNLLDLIDNYGQVAIDVDYRNDFTLIKTIDGSESGDVFNKPRGLAVCPSTDNVYVTDDTTIRVYDSDGVYIRHVVTDDQTRGVAIDSKQRVIVTSEKDTKVKIYSCELKLMKTFGSEGAQNGQFMAVYDVRCDQDDNIYVADFCNHRVQVFTHDGTFLSVIGRGILQYPMNIQINHRQEVMVTNYSIGDLHIFRRDGKYILTITATGATELMSPRGICVDSTGRILVGANKTNKIQVFTWDGIPYCTLGEPAAAMMDIQDLAVTASGVIFITDGKHNKLHMIAST